METEEIHYLGLPIAPSLYAENQKGDTSDISDFSARKVNEGLDLAAKPAHR